MRLVVRDIRAHCLHHSVKEILHAEVVSDVIDRLNCNPFDDSLAVIVVREVSSPVELHCAWHQLLWDQRLVPS